mmetsp:Transcript_11348/g.20880  ORF Transcript_11348/g.20880 Transcript_11348/m.20880 type:complete len:246 (+) Transcript_11348:1823-2560(+)
MEGQLRLPAWHRCHIRECRIDGLFIVVERTHHLAIGRADVIAPSIAHAAAPCLVHCVARLRVWVLVTLDNLDKPTLLHHLTQPITEIGIHITKRRLPNRLLVHHLNHQSQHLITQYRNIAHLRTQLIEFLLGHLIQNTLDLLLHLGHDGIVLGGHPGVAGGCEGDKVIVRERILILIAVIVSSAATVSLTSSSFLGGWGLASIPLIAAAATPSSSSSSSTTATTIVILIVALALVALGRGHLASS